jgi:hypothetical protein
VKKRKKRKLLSRAAKTDAEVLERHTEQQNQCNKFENDYFRGPAHIHVMHMQPAPPNCLMRREDATRTEALVVSLKAQGKAPGGAPLLLAADNDMFEHTDEDVTALELAERAAKMGRKLNILGGLHRYRATLRVLGEANAGTVKTNVDGYWECHVYGGK